MASTPLTPIVSAFDLTTSWETIYQVSDSLSRIGIDAAVFNNYTASNVSYSVRIVQTGAAGVLSEIITEKTIRAQGNDLASALIGQSVISGGIIQAKANVNSSVSASITATTFT